MLLPYLTHTPHMTLPTFMPGIVTTWINCTSTGHILPHTSPLYNTLTSAYSCTIRSMSNTLHTYNKAQDWDPFHLFMQRYRCDMALMFFLEINFASILGRFTSVHLTRNQLIQGYATISILQRHAYFQELWMKTIVVQHLGQSNSHFVTGIIYHFQTKHLQ